MEDAIGGVGCQIEAAHRIQVGIAEAVGSQMTANGYVNPVVGVCTDGAGGGGDGAAAGIHIHLGIAVLTVVQNAPLCFEVGAAACGDMLNLHFTVGSLQRHAASRRSNIVNHLVSGELGDGNVAHRRSVQCRLGEKVDIPDAIEGSNKVHLDLAVFIAEDVPTADIRGIVIVRTGQKIFAHDVGNDIFLPATLFRSKLGGCADAANSRSIAVVFRIDIGIGAISGGAVLGLFANILILVHLLYIGVRNDRLILGCNTFDAGSGDGHIAVGGYHFSGGEGTAALPNGNVSYIQKIAFPGRGSDHKHQISGLVGLILNGRIITDQRFVSTFNQSALLRIGEGLPVSLEELCFVVQQRFCLVDGRIRIALGIFRFRGQIALCIQIQRCPAVIDSLDGIAVLIDLDLLPADNAGQNRFHGSVHTGQVQQGADLGSGEAVILTQLAKNCIAELTMVIAALLLVIGLVFQPNLFVTELRSIRTLSVQLLPHCRHIGELLLQGRRAVFTDHGVPQPLHLQGCHTGEGFGDAFFAECQDIPDRSAGKLAIHELQECLLRQIPSQLLCQFLGSLIRDPDLNFFVTQVADTLVMLRLNGVSLQSAGILTIFDLGGNIGELGKVNVVGVANVQRQTGFFVFAFEAHLEVTLGSTNIAANIEEHLFSIFGFPGLLEVLVQDQLGTAILHQQIAAGFAALGRIAGGGDGHQAVHIDSIHNHVIVVAACLAGIDGKLACLIDFHLVHVDLAGSAGDFRSAIDDNGVVRRGAVFTHGHAAAAGIEIQLAALRDGNHIHIHIAIVGAHRCFAADIDMVHIDRTHALVGHGQITGRSDVHSLHGDAAVALGADFCRTADFSIRQADTALAGRYIHNAADDNVLTVLSVVPANAHIAFFGADSEFAFAALAVAQNADIFHAHIAAVFHVHGEFPAVFHDDIFQAGVALVDFKVNTAVLGNTGVMEIDVGLK